MTTDWLSGDVVANGVRLHYVRTGHANLSPADTPREADAVKGGAKLSPSGTTREADAVKGGAQTTLLMLHGITDSGRTWARVAEALAPDYDVVMLDARGHGLSAAPESGYTAEEQAPDVAGVIRALGLGRVILIGHSMGGATAVATAAHFPEVVRALILEDPPWGGAQRASASPSQKDDAATGNAQLSPASTSRETDAVAGGAQQSPASPPQKDDSATGNAQLSPAGTSRETDAVAGGAQPSPVIPPSQAARAESNAPGTSPADARAARIAEWQRSILKRKAQPLAEIIAFGTRRLPTWGARDIEAWAEAKQQASPNIARGINGRGIRWQAVVRLVRCPLWVIYGDRAAGAILTPATVQEAQALAPQLKAVHVPGAGHEIRRGSYAPFMEALRACLRDVTSGPP